MPTGEEEEEEADTAEDGRRKATVGGTTTPTGEMERGGGTAGAAAVETIMAPEVDTTAYLPRGTSVRLPGKLGGEGREAERGKICTYCDD